MKYYETHYEEYIQSLEHYTLHPELEEYYQHLPNELNQLCHLIIYGPTGSGKYTQALNIIRKYSSCALKYDKKILAQTDKQKYFYRISDIHYEIDMSLLGCNSKLIWHEIFLQIIDIVSSKPHKSGILLCKNFHSIHNELLEVFYSYIQQTKNDHSYFQHLHIKFILITEQISFIPNHILNCCSVFTISRPTKEKYLEQLDVSIETTKRPPITAQLSKTHFTNKEENIDYENKYIWPFH